ncbi:MAG: diaminopropionate ammonia-lyase [Chloroflexaceae bacterium]|nr:diaminopropionate ammonia-lyase [Chloroflexaceae bacterium]
MITDYVYNAHVPATLPAARPTREPLAFHQRLPGYAPTPLIDAPALAARLGVGQVLIKNEAERIGMPAYKILGAAWATYHALRERLNGDLPAWNTLEELAQHMQPLQPLTLAAATDGNHGRAVARVARLLGLGAHIFVPTGTAAARIAAIASEGAQVTVVDGTYDEAVARSAQEAGPHCAVISDTAWEGYTDVPTRVIAGYSTIFWEIEDELARRAQPGPDLVLVQTGVGALAAAVIGHYRRADRTGPVPRIVNIEPYNAACVLASMKVGRIVEVPGPHNSVMAGLNCGLPSPVAWPLVSQGIDLYIALDDAAALQAMRDLATIAIVAGETGAVGMAGATDLLTGPDAVCWRELLGVTDQSRILLM